MQVSEHDWFPPGTKAPPAGYTEILQENHYYPFGMGMEGPWHWPDVEGRVNGYQYNGKEFNGDLGLGWNDYGARWYDGVVGRFLSVDPLAVNYAAWSTYNYVLGNPVRFVDPDGRSVDDIIFRTKLANGNYKELGRIKTDDHCVTFDIDSKHLASLNLEKISPVVVDGGDAERKGFNTQAASLNISGEAAYKVGAQAELSIIGMIAGPEKGEWGIALQVNRLVGLEGGVTASMSVYEPVGENRQLLLNDLQGFEYGVQADAFYNAASYFRGVEFSASPPFVKDVYQGFSVGMSTGVLEVPASGSAYIGFSAFLYKSM